MISNFEKDRIKKIVPFWIKGDKKHHKKIWKIFKKLGCEISFPSSLFKIESYIFYSDIIRDKKVVVCMISDSDYIECIKEVGIEIMIED